MLADAPHEQSLVGGLFNTSLQVGGGVGLRLMSAVAATKIDPGLIALLFVRVAPTTA